MAVTELSAGDEFYFCVETEYLKRSFSAGKTAGKKKLVTSVPNVYYLCDEGISMGKRFTGAMLGMYAYAGETPLFVRFMDFSYEGKDKNR